MFRIIFFKVNNEREVISMVLKISNMYTYNI